MFEIYTKYFEYGEKEILYLKGADRRLGDAIDKLGKVERIIIPDLFQALIYAVIGQQISVRAANTVFDRIQQRFGDITPKNISKLLASEIQQCGMTMRKAVYIKDIAEAAGKGDFNFQELYELSDKEVIKRLCSLNGIGTWTAEMLLLNAMERPDVVSYGDIAIRRGMMKLYGLSELTKDQFCEYKSRYSPYGSVASIYLWKLSFE